MGRVHFACRSMFAENSWLLFYKGGWWETELCVYVQVGEPKQGSCILSGSCSIGDPFKLKNPDSMSLSKISFNGTLIELNKLNTHKTVYIFLMWPLTYLHELQRSTETLHLALWGEQIFPSLWNKNKIISYI